MTFDDADLTQERLLKVLRSFPIEEGDELTIVDTGGLAYSIPTAIVLSSDHFLATNDSGNASTLFLYLRFEFLIFIFIPIVFYVVSQWSKLSEFYDFLSTHCHSCKTRILKFYSQCKEEINNLFEKKDTTFVGATAFVKEELNGQSSEIEKKKNWPVCDTISSPLRSSMHNVSFCLTNTCDLDSSDPPELISEQSIQSVYTNNDDHNYYTNAPLALSKRKVDPEKDAREIALFACQWKESFRRALSEQGSDISDEHDALCLQFALRRYSEQVDIQYAEMKEARRFVWDGQQRSMDRSLSVQLNEKILEAQREQKCWLPLLQDARNQCIGRVQQMTKWALVATFATLLMFQIVDLREVIRRDGFYNWGTSLVFHGCNSTQSLSSNGFYSSLASIWSYMPHTVQLYSLCHLLRSTNLAIAIAASLLFPTKTLLIFVAISAIVYWIVWGDFGAITSLVQAFFCLLMLHSVISIYIHQKYTKFCNQFEKEAQKKGAPMSSEVSLAIKWFDNHTHWIVLILLISTLALVSFLRYY